MSSKPLWWRKPRKLSIVVDNPSWVLPWAERAVREFVAAGDEAELIKDYRSITTGSVAFFWGCLRVCPVEVLRLNQRNLVVHASDLPKDRGFSPWTWAILEGASQITVSLIDADANVDSGDIYDRCNIDFEGHELIDEIRSKVGAAHLLLGSRFLSSDLPPAGQKQVGEPTWRRRRRPDDSRLDPQLPLASQFNLLRVVDNEKYPAFFELRGHRYVVRISKHEQ